MRRERGLTLVEVVVVALVVGVSACVVLPMLARAAEEARRARSLDDYNGAEWLASLYWLDAVQDRGVFICPSSGDTNRGGEDLGRRWASPRFGSQTVSYAGLNWRRLIWSSFDEPTASDDTQGTINHAHGRASGMNVVFRSGRVEFKDSAELDPRTAVGAGTRFTGSLLWQLRD